MIIPPALLLLLLSGEASSVARTEVAPRSYRMIDVDGDGMLDRLEVDAEGALSISLNRGARQFEPVFQELPRIAVHDVLAGDLNGDGHTDLYLVSSGPNAVLLGDGFGLFVEDEGALGLEDAGAGIRAERVDVDADGIADVLLHNAGGDVVFWGTPSHAFERDAFASASVQPFVGVSTADDVTLAETALAAPPAAGASTSTGAKERRRDASSGARATDAAHGAGETGTSGVHLDAGGPVSTTVEEVLELRLPPCVPGVKDATTGMCLTADSVPTLGALYPLGSELNILPTGEVGMGTTAPVADLHLAGSLFPELRISPNTQLLNQGGAQLFLSEGLTTNCGWRISYDGALDNQLKFISECTTPETRLAIDRTTGDVLVGGEDFSSTNAGPGLLRVTGDVSQTLGDGGLIKAGVHVDGSVPSISRSFNNLPGGSTPTVTRLGTGIYEVDFGATNVSQRFYIGTIGGATPLNAVDGTIEVTPRSGNVNAVFIEIDDENGVSVDSDFYLAIF